MRAVALLRGGRTAGLHEQLVVQPYRGQRRSVRADVVLCAVRTSGARDHRSPERRAARQLLPAARHSLPEQPQPQRLPQHQGRRCRRH